MKINSSTSRGCGFLSATCACFINGEVIDLVSIRVFYKKIAIHVEIKRQFCYMKSIFAMCKWARGLTLYFSSLSRKSVRENQSSNTERNKRSFPKRGRSDLMKNVVDSLKKENVIWLKPLILFFFFLSNRYIEVHFTFQIKKENKSYDHLTLYGPLKWT